LSWLCKCGINNANLNVSCSLCREPRVSVISTYDEIDELKTKVILWNLQLAELGLARRTKMNDSNMSPKEKLFAKFFSEEKTLISSMDDMMLRAHIEELQNIAFEARARLTASDDEARERTAKKKSSVRATVENDDKDFTSAAINNLNERSKKMSKVEKEIERLVTLGIAREDAENMYKASTVVTIKKQGVDAVLEDTRVKDIVNSIVNATNEEKKLFVNPFTNKVEVSETVEEKEVEILNKQVESINEQIEKQKNEEPIVEVKKSFINPFARKD